MLNLQKFAGSLIFVALAFQSSAQRRQPSAITGPTAKVGGNWAQQFPAASPPARAFSTMAYDAAIGQVVLFSGQAATLAADTWTYNGTAWTQQAPAVSPPARSFSTMAYDAATGQVVLFGGVGGNGLLADTWTYNGTTWTHQIPSVSPPARYNSTMTYDAATGQVVLFGGQNFSGTTYGDTWTYNGTTWTQQSPATSPSTRYGSTTTYNPSTGQVVLFGGQHSGGTYLGDTWTYNGTTWTQQSPSASPPAREYSLMAYDAASGQVVLFSGYNGADSNDTWTYDGTTWTQQSPATSPSARDGAAMAYDTVTGQVVLFGGTVYPGSTFFADTWNYAAGTFIAPSTAVGNAAAQTPVYFAITGSGTLPALSNANVITQGAPNLDFTLGTGSTCTGAVTAGQTCAVNVAFTPKAPGQRLGAVDLLDSNGNVLATALVSGTGTGPAMTFPSNTARTLLGSYSNYDPTSLAVDAAGDVFVADNNHNAVEEIVAVGGTIPSNSTIRTLGSGFNAPTAVAVDGAGNVFVADNGNGTIKEIMAVSGAVPASNPTIRTLASGFGNPQGIAVDGSGDVFVADQSATAIKEIVAVGGAVPASNPTIRTLGSGLNHPFGLAVDGAGNVFVTDYGSNTVKEILAVGGSVPSSNPTINTLGSGFKQPQAVAVDSAGDVYVADNGNNAVKEIVAVGGSIPASNPTIFSLGSGISAPTGVAVDGAGNLFLVDNSLNSPVTELKLVAPSALTFPNTPVGSSSASQTVTLQNVGNAALTFPIPSTGQNPSQSNYFTLGNTSTCITLTNASSNSVSLAPGTSCTEYVSFSPTISGAVTGNLIFTDNNLNATNTTQTVVETGSTASSLTVSVVSQNTPQGTTSITLGFTVGWGGNTAPTGTPTFTVNGSSANVGAVSCVAKTGHSNCSVTYNPSALAPGQYTITATQPADSNYPATSANGTLTVVGATNRIKVPVMIAPINTLAPVRSALTR